MKCLTIVFITCCIIALALSAEAVRNRRGDVVPVNGRCPFPLAVDRDNPARCVKTIPRIGRRSINEEEAVRNRRGDVVPVNGRCPFPLVVDRDNPARCVKTIPRIGRRSINEEEQLNAQVNPIE